MATPCRAYRSSNVYIKNFKGVNFSKKKIKKIFSHVRKDLA